MVVKQTEYQWLYVFASVDPQTGESSAILNSTLNTAYASAFRLVRRWASFRTSG